MVTVLRLALPVMVRRHNERTGIVLPVAAPVAQGIEHCPPEAVAQVRILPGAHNIAGGDALESASPFWFSEVSPSSVVRGQVLAELQSSIMNVGPKPTEVI